MPKTQQQQHTIIKLSLSTIQKNTLQSTIFLHRKRLTLSSLASEHHSYFFSNKIPSPNVIVTHFNFIIFIILDQTKKKIEIYLHNILFCNICKLPIFYIIIRTR